MFKRLTPTMVALCCLAAPSAHAGFDEVAATFPSDIVPIDAGKIDFWAKLEGYSGVIGWGQQPTLYSASKPPGGWSLNFNGNDGTGSAGLTGSVANDFQTGTGPWTDTFTYEQLLPGGGWHRYTVAWHKDGLAGDPARKIEIYLDGVLNSGIVRPSASTPGVWDDLVGAKFDLITTSFPQLTGKVLLDEFRIYDGSGAEVFYNTLDSIAAIETSAVGRGGTFAGGYGAHFEPGLVGNALAAGVVPEPQTWALMALGLGLLGFRARQRR